MENPPPASKKTSFHPFAILLTFCTISIVFIYLIYSGNFVFGSDAGGWVYPNKPWIVTIPRWIPVLSLLCVGIMVFLGSKLIQKHEKLTLLGCLALAITLQISVSSMVYNTLGDIILSHDANSFYIASQQYTPAALLAQYQSSISSLPGHASTNMPGKVLLFHLLSVFTQNTQTMGYLIISISALGALLLYGICKHLFHDKQVGLYAFALYALIPCKQEFFPILNTVTPIFILLCLYLFSAFLDLKKKWLLVLLGISLYLLVFFEPSPLVIGILFIGILINAIGQKSLSIKELIGVILITLFSFLATHLLLWVAFSFDIFKTFLYMLKDAAEFNSTSGRPYSIWLRENLKEFFYGAGLPVMMIFVLSLIDLLSNWKYLFINRFRWSIENTYLVSLLITFCVVLFLGINRGEVTRLWIYLAVFFQIPAAQFLVKTVKRNLAFMIIAGTVLLQTLVSLQRIVFIVK
jgi:hypothetical protein